VPRAIAIIVLNLQRSAPAVAGNASPPPDFPQESREPFHRLQPAEIHRASGTLWAIDVRDPQPMGTVSKDLRLPRRFRFRGHPFGVGDPGPDFVGRQLAGYTVERPFLVALVANRMAEGAFLIREQLLAFRYLRVLCSGSRHEAETNRHRPNRVTRRRSLPGYWRRKRPAA